MHPLEALDFSTRVAQRAQYEAFSFTVLPAGIRVRNESYLDPAAHEYEIAVDDGIPVCCSCPADDRYGGACKHRVAVAIYEAGHEALAVHQEQASRVAVDGGRAPDDEPSTQPALPATSETVRSTRIDPNESTESDQPLDESTDDGDDECDDCSPDFPCWECVRIGRRDLPGERSRP
ncbi:SWIM zinc finger family protein [Halomicrobium salinisoli]|uniref:SWIM zinc finger family protein n=1 Tax=Halomicrobium salinisoli TaxID=2878391 RepID=UPI001CEFB8BD|nr:SWIM zinc finger family protein [Halomicrobium salinisoli]